MIGPSVQGHHRPPSIGVQEKRLGEGAPVLSRRVTVVFTGHAEQVPLVVVGGFLGRDQQHPVVDGFRLATGANGDAASDGTVEIPGESTHPFLGGATRLLGIGQGVHGEARGEHFGQYHQVGRATEVRQ